MAKTLEEKRAKNRAYKREWRAKNPEKVKEHQKKYRNTPRGRASKLLGCYNFHDKKRGLPQGDLTIEDVEELIQQPCAHCGKTGFDVIGLNRLDNNLPHTKANVEPCCLSCNSSLGSIERWEKHRAGRS